MKSLNLLSLIDAKKDLSIEVLSNYLDNYSVKISDNELDDLYSLVENIQRCHNDLEIFENFFVGYSIPQISREFDLLRIGNNNVINIELKKIYTGKERIEKQLKRNKYYLSFLDKETFNYTYVDESNKLYSLNEAENLIEQNINELIDKLIQQEVPKIKNIDNLFDPSNYLVSPFNSTDVFVEGKYFLTNHQETIRKSILEDNPTTQPCYISIYGAAGTGKTLLTYDIAKYYINESKEVIIFHCGNLNEGHDRLNSNYSWPIVPIKEVDRHELTTYNLIVIDEIQRIRKNQLNRILESLKDTNVKCIFSYDPKQCLHRNEIFNNIPEYIEDKVPVQKHELTEKIRTNNEIASFIKNLFDLSKINPTQKYSNIEISYFSDYSDAKKYLDILNRRDWKVINYTPSRDSYPYRRYNICGEDSAHGVIGQEFDKVVAVIDEYFHYNKEGKLATEYRGYYHVTKMLFQILTRTRKKLNIIIINNEVLLEKCLKILNRKK
ncbi:uncharacterized protein DUF2075 [Halanaerobium saccharolyticum]|uniref:Uncharacterized protein DUF2075 n=1 Tax=Halanaerobium saccharolyticum TaxID=43595 RepID=A0A4R7YIS7_9FIRM|nr:ATP-binding protein [Halanaerobium saccharolyticum]RAK03958.1 uncharacterized protein DUF2075 [Halanaerobium saccharolyticum]TDV97310.1 uncharacterized protein DUF2075 [Halanaerobium saccharolyticum]TDX49044.1 uncharacterized protein DUF2075 [Halanaerobium saccharolyticum]